MRCKMDYRGKPDNEGSLKHFHKQQKPPLRLQGSLLIVVQRKKLKAF